MFAIEHSELIGWHADIPNDVYHKSPGISKSTTDLLSKSYRHYLRRDMVRRETDAMRLGTAVHSAILEPHTWPGEFVRGPETDKRSKEWKEAVADAAESKQMLLPAPDYDKVELMRDAVQSHPTASKLFHGGIAEGSIFWEDEDTGLLLKCRPDYLILGDAAPMCVDLKTTKSALPAEFEKSVANFRYDVQHAFYVDGIAAQFGGYPNFVFVAVESEEPHNVSVMRIKKADVQRARAQYKSDLQVFLNNQIEGTYDGYHEHTVEISVPRWAKRTK